MRYEDVHRPEQTIIIDYRKPVKFPWSRHTPVLNRIAEQPVLAQRVVLGRDFDCPLYLPDGTKTDPAVNEVLSLTLLPPNEVHIPLGQYLGYMSSRYDTEFGVWDRLLTFGEYGAAVFARLGNFASLVFNYDFTSRQITARHATRQEEEGIKKSLQAKRVQDKAGESVESKATEGSKLLIHPIFEEVHVVVRDPMSMLPLETILQMGYKAN